MVITFFFFSFFCGLEGAAGYWNFFYSSHANYLIRKQNQNKYKIEPTYINQMPKKSYKQPKTKKPPYK